MRSLVSYWPEAVRAGLTIAFLAVAPVGIPLGALVIVLSLIWLWDR